jgi:hypothetical protein
VGERLGSLMIAVSSRPCPVRSQFPESAPPDCFRVFNAGCGATRSPSRPRFSRPRRRAGAD